MLTPPASRPHFARKGHVQGGGSEVRAVGMAWICGSLGFVSTEEICKECLPTSARRRPRRGLGPGLHELGLTRTIREHRIASRDASKRQGIEKDAYFDRTDHHLSELQDRNPADGITRGATHRGDQETVRSGFGEEGSRDRGPGSGDQGPGEGVGDGARICGYDDRGEACGRTSAHCG